jgi:type II secretory pathway pseudopilin PulG
MARQNDRAFTLIELLVVVGMIAFLIAVLLPALSSARKASMSARLAAMSRAAAMVDARDKKPAAAPAALPAALVKSFTADVELTPQLSVGTAQPESIYESKFSATLIATRSDTDNGPHVVQLPLPPQIISLSDLSMKVNGQATDSVQITDDKLAWTGPLSATEPSTMEITYSAMGRGIFALETPPARILDQFKIKLAAKGSDVRMLELSLQPTQTDRKRDQTIYTWDYKRLLFGRPISLDVLGIAPVDRLGELSWLGPISVVCFGLMLGLIAKAYQVERIDKWMLIMIIGTFTGAYPLMYFAQELVPFSYAMLLAGGLVLAIITLRAVTLAGLRIGILGVVIPAAAIMTLTLTATIRPQLQGILITSLGLALFVIAMILSPRLRALRQNDQPAAPVALA